MYMCVCICMLAVYSVSIFDYIITLQSSMLQYVSKQCLDQIFSSTWKSREAGIQHLARDMVSLLMPSLTHRTPSNGDPSHEQLQRSSVVRCALEACCPIIAYSCTDSVLKVYLAALVSHWTYQVTTIIVWYISTTKTTCITPLSIGGMIQKYIVINVDRSIVSDVTLSMYQHTLLLYTPLLQVNKVIPPYCQLTIVHDSYSFSVSSIRQLSVTQYVSTWMVTMFCDHDYVLAMFALTDGFGFIW